MPSSAPFFFFFFFAAVSSSCMMVSSAPFFFFFFFAAVSSSFTMISAPFFFFFFLAADRSSLFTTLSTAGAANTGVRLVEARKPSAAMMAVNLRMVDILLCLDGRSPALRLCGGRARLWLQAQSPPNHFAPLHHLAAVFKYNRQKNAEISVT